MYILHIVIMKYNHTYEVALKRSVANFLEIRELNKLASDNIGHFHYNLDTRNISIEILNKIEFKQEGDIIIFEMDKSSNYKETINKGQFMSKMNNKNTIKYRMKPISRIKIGEERFATKENKKLMARAKFKRAVIKILTKLQAYHLYEKIKRNKLCITPIYKFVKDYQPIGRESQQETKFSVYDDSDEVTDDEREEDSSAEYDDSVDISEVENRQNMFDDN